MVEYQDFGVVCCLSRVSDEFDRFDNFVHHHSEIADPTPSTLMSTSIRTVVPGGRPRQCKETHLLHDMIGRM